MPLWLQLPQRVRSLVSAVCLVRRTVHTHHCSASVTRFQLPYFREYKTYCSNYESALRLLSEMQKKKDVEKYLRVQSLR
jgi:hypothetical protein